MGVYQRLDLSTGRTVWILLQPSQEVYRSVVKSLQKRHKGERSITEKHQVLGTSLRHSLFLSIAGENWSSYCEDLQRELTRIVRKATIYIP